MNAEGPTVERPLRKDAELNRRRILAAARDLFAETLGPSHPNTATARASWGLTQIELGNPEQALPAIEQAVRGGAEEISRILGFVGDWPAGDPGGAAG